MMMLAHLLATIALALPALSDGDAPLDKADGVDVAAVPEGPPLIPRALGEGAIAPLAQVLPQDRWQQVRIEQRLIIRITPRTPGRETLAVVPPQVTVRLRERRTGNCLPVAAIAGVKPISDSRLLLFLRDRRLIGADLAKTCSARDFYLGFYVTQTSDGQLCVARDTIHSRAGTTCVITQVRELVPGD